MRKELVKRFEKMKMDCSKCPISEKDCKWMAQTFQKPNKPKGKAKKWCPLLITIGNIMAFLELGDMQPSPESKHSTKNVCKRRCKGCR